MIDSFHGKYRFLSNFAFSKVELDGYTYPTVEHAYQAAKTTNPILREHIWLAATPGKAKRLGRQVILRPDWDEIRLSVMEDLLRQKFSNPLLRQKLRGTSPHELVEGNTWGDRFWGVCNGEGENHLGRLLMKIRDERG